MKALKLPNFILAGAGESGTTSLYRYLKQHSQVYMSPLKEPNFFAAADILSLPNFTPLQDGQLSSLLADIGARKCSGSAVSITKWEDYQRLFQNVGDEVAIGEASVMYLWFPSAAPAIHRTLPRAKLIFLLRDPAERLHTLYARTLRAGPPISFRDWILPAIHAKPDRRLEMQRHPIPLDCGLYATHLGRFLDLFPREQIRIHLYESYRANAPALLKDIFEFLGVDSAYPIDFSERQNETLVPRAPAVHEWRRRLFGDAKLAGWMPAPLRSQLRRLYNRPRGDLTLAPDDRQLVVDYYRDELLRTQDLIGRDLSAWLR